MPTYPLVLVRPPRHPRAVPRPRLTTWEGDHAATVIIGPAGSGKTVAAVQLAAAAGGRVAWCRVGPGYAQAADVAAIAAESVGAGPPANGDPLVLAGHLLELLEGAPTVLVIDDYHHADAASTDPVLGELLPLVPPASRVVVTSRTRPAGLIGRVSPGLLSIVDAEVLAFTTEEAASLFEAAGRPAAEAGAWQSSTAGWAAALAVAAQSPATAADGDLTAVVERLVLDGLDPQARRLLEAMSVLPYLTADLVEGLGVGDGTALEALAQRTGVLADVGGQWRLHDVVRDAVRAVAGTDGVAVRELRRRAADLLVRADPEAAVEVLLDAGDPEAAASVLEARLSDVGVERAVGFVYRMPAALRRRLPPLLTAGRATVDLDAASAAAAQRVQAAVTDDERAEALLALGSARAGAGDLGAAVEALEPVAAGGGARGRLALAWLGIVRWWAGDLAGARAALDGAGDTVWSCWARASVALVGDDLDGAATWAAQAVAGAGAGATAAPGASVQAAVLLVRGDLAGAEASTTTAYELGLAAGGFDLACGAAAMAVLRAVQGRYEEALTACDLLERRVGRHDHHARLQAALVRKAVALSGGDIEERERASRRVRDLRRAGFAPVEQVAARLLPVLAAPSGPTLRVELLGDGQVIADGAVRAGWRSQKALEALRFLAIAGARGARREEMIEAIWPGREPDKGRTLLRTALSEIRRLLEPDRPPGEASRFLETAGGRVVLRARTDLDDAAAATDADAAFSILARPMVDIEGEWAEDVARDVIRRRLEAAERVAAAGGPAAVAALEILIEAEPWRRELYDALIALHRAAGDDAAARAAERRWFEDDA